MKKLKVLLKVLGIGTLFFLTFIPALNADPNDIIIGLDADISSGSAQSGKAILRGAVIAMDEINGNGGVLGRNLRLIVIRPPRKSSQGNRQYGRIFKNRKSSF